MSAMGRLWRRAPAWRLSLISAVAFTALAAMFPPPLPHWWPAFMGREGAAGKQNGTLVAAPPGAASSPLPAAHFTPQPDQAPLDSGALEVPHNAADRVGVIPFGGRQIPLPVGIWKDIVLVRMGGVIPGQEEVLARIENGQLTGLLMADAPSPTSGAAGPLATPAACYTDNTILREIAPETPGQNPMAHECWILVDSDITAAASRAKVDDITRRALNRVEETGAHVPDHMLMMVYMRSSETGWLRVLLLLPVTSDVTAAASHRIQNWVKRFAVEFHQGYDSKIPASGIPQVIAKDPT
jgi:hypothetical protein